MRIVYMATWNVKCGIARYTSDLIMHLPVDIRYAIWDEPKFWNRNINNYDLLHNAVGDFSPDIIHVQHSPNFFPHSSFIDFCNSLKVPLILTLHDTNDNIAQALSSIKKATFIVPLDMCRRILCNYIDSKNVRVIEHGATKFDIVPEAKKKLRIDSKTKVITQFGFYGVDKNMCDSVRAFDKVQDKNSIFIFLGSLHPLAIPEHKVALKDAMILAHRLGLDNRVKFVGEFLSEEALNIYFSATDVFLFNHKHIFPVYSASASIKRVLYAGKPLVISNSPLYSEFSDREVMRFNSGEY